MIDQVIHMDAILSLTNFPREVRAHALYLFFDAPLCISFGVQAIGLNFSQSVAGCILRSLNLLGTAFLHPCSLLIKVYFGDLPDKALTDLKFKGSWLGLKFTANF